MMIVPFLKRNLRVITVVCVCIAGGIGLYLLSRSRSFQVYGEIYHKVECSEKLVALTFDDGPTEKTGQILAMLNRYDVKATFFLIGRDMERHPHYGLAIVRAGHQLGNHSYHHKRMVFKTYHFIESEIQKTDSLIRKAGYTDEIVFRPPYGKKLFFLPYYLNQHRKKTITWNIDPESYDDVSGTASQINRYVNQQIAAGSIILLHPMNGSEATLQSIPLIIKSLKAKGYRFVTVNELLRFSVPGKS